LDIEETEQIECCCLTPRQVDDVDHRQRALRRAIVGMCSRRSRGARRIPRVGVQRLRVEVTVASLRPVR
jgi:hypothetical protein